MFKNSASQINTIKLKNTGEWNGKLSTNGREIKDSMNIPWDDNAHQPNVWWNAMQRGHWPREVSSENEHTILRIVVFKYIFFLSGSWMIASYPQNKTSSSLCNVGDCFCSLVAEIKFGQLLYTQQQKWQNQNWMNRKGNEYSLGHFAKSSQTVNES